MIQQQIDAAQSRTAEDQHSRQDGTEFVGGGAGKLVVQQPDNEQETPDGQARHGRPHTPRMLVAARLTKRQTCRLSVPGSLASNPSPKTVRSP